MRSVLLTAAALLAIAPLARAASPGQALVDLETKWSAAMVAKDTATLQSIVAPDWVSQGPDGTTTTADLLAGIKGGKISSSAMTNHDVHARVFGTIAVVQGADDETSMHGAKTTNGTYTWTDVFQKRHGHWMAVASHVTLPTKP